MSGLFGTDGVRGVANAELTPELALALGRALVAVLLEAGHRRPVVLVGRDPRWSGELLEAALVAGITSAGGDAITVGVVPTPGVAYMTVAAGAAAGAVISASHNPMGDNGIKFFDASGFKLSDEQEARIEALLGSDALPRPTGTGIGRRFNDSSAVARYVEHLVDAAATDLGGLKVVVDGANGAASRLAPQVYRQLGADVVPIHCSPDGANINRDCGSTDPAALRQAVLDHRADLGVAHDGDADRVIAVTHRGTIVDGDVLLAILARHRHQQGTLKGDAVVTTVMTNLGFHLAMQQLGIEVIQTPVGDRHVLDVLRRRDLVLGGEQSGHIIQLDRSTTGDGLLTAVSLMSVLRAADTTLEELAGVMQRVPQVLHNVPVRDRSALDGCTPVWDAVREVEARLGGAGRVLVRASGTEPVVRVMVEAVRAEDAETAAAELAEVVRRYLS